MANEISVRASLAIRKDSANIDYQSRPTSFTATMAGTKGPTPGSFDVSVHGTDVSLAELGTLGGWCRIRNCDPTNYVEYGVWDSVTLVFYPFGELLAGEFCDVRLSRNLGKDEPGTSTVAAIGTTTFRMKANLQTCQVLVEAFDA